MCGSMFACVCVCVCANDMLMPRHTFICNINTRARRKHSYKCIVRILRVLRYVCMRM